MSRARIRVARAGGDRPGHDLTPSPQTALTLADRLGEAAHVDDLARPLVAHAKDVGDLDDGR